MANPVNFPNQYIQYENTGLPNQYIQSENTGLPNQYIQHENTGLPNQYQEAPRARPVRKNRFGGEPGYDPTGAKHGARWTGCPYGRPPGSTNKPKMPKGPDDDRPKKKGRPEGAKNKEKIAPRGPEAFLPTPDSSNSPNEDGGSQIPTSTIYHTAPLLPPLATTVAQPTSRPVGHAQTTGSPEEKWGGDLLEEYPGINIPLLDADSYNYGDYGNYGNSSSSSLYSYPNQPPSTSLGTELSTSRHLQSRKGTMPPTPTSTTTATTARAARVAAAYPTRTQTKPRVNLTGYQPYDTPTPTISQGYNAPSSSIDTNINRLRAQSSLNPKATAAAQDNFTSPLNPWAQTDNYLFYPDPDPFSFDNDSRAQSSLNPKATAAAQDNFTSPLNLWEQTDDYLFYPDLDPFSFDNNLWGI